MSPRVTRAISWIPAPVAISMSFFGPAHVASFVNSRRPVSGPARPEDTILAGPHGVARQSYFGPAHVADFSLAERGARSRDARMEESKRVSAIAEKLGVSYSWVVAAEANGFTEREMLEAAAKGLPEADIDKFDEAALYRAVFDKSAASRIAVTVPPATGARRAK